MPELRAWKRVRYLAPRRTRTSTQQPRWRARFSGKLSALCTAVVHSTQTAPPGKYRPYAFTEHGAIQAANVLSSPRAIEMGVFVVRAFVKLRQMLASNAELSRRLDELESKYDRQFKIVFDAIRKLMSPAVRDRKEIGFRSRSVKK